MLLTLVFETFDFMANNMDEEELEQPKDSDDEDVPVPDDEPVSRDICGTCGQPIVNLSKEAADEYRHSRQWFKCGCGLQSIILGPPQKPKEYEDIGAWHRRQKMMR